MDALDLSGVCALGFNDNSDVIVFFTTVSAMVLGYGSQETRGEEEVRRILNSDWCGTLPHKIGLTHASPYGFESFYLHRKEGSKGYPCICLAFESMQNRGPRVVPHTFRRI